MVIRFDNFLIATDLSKNSVRISLNSELKFEEHINKICNTITKKLKAVLHRIASHINLGKQHIRLRAFNKSQFNYCSLIWMFY